MSSDTPSGESGELNTDSAADVFTKLLSEPEEAPVDTEVDEPKKEEEETDETEREQGVEEGDDAPITLEVDGKPVTLTKAQIADAYKNGLRQSDYTQKTMAVAEQRKAAEAQTEKAQQERQAYAQQLVKMAAQLEGAIQQQERIDWDTLIANDPHEALKQQHLLQKRQAALQQSTQELSRIEQMTQAERAEASKSHLATQQQELLAKLPQWKDDATASKERDAIKAYLVKEGYDPDSVASINDHKAVVLSRKAMLYDQMMAKANAAAKKMQTTPEKVIRPGVSVERSTSGSTAAMRAHTKAGTVDTAAAWFASNL